MRKLRLLDIFIFLLLFLLSLSFMQRGGTGESVRIDADGKSYIFPLSEDRMLSFHGPLGETVVEIKDNDVRIISSPCPEQTCLTMKIGNAICCLPNRILIETTNGEGGYVDEVSF